MILTVHSEWFDTNGGCNVYYALPEGNAGDGRTIPDHQHVSLGTATVGHQHTIEQHCTLPAKHSAQLLSH